MKIKLLMKSLIFFISILTIITIPTFATDLGVNHTFEIGGLYRDLFGLSIRSIGEELLGFEIQFLTPVESKNPFENIEYLIRNFNDIKYIQILPFIILNFKRGTLNIYAGFAPMLSILYEKVDNGPREFKFRPFSPYMFSTKLGLQLNLSFLAGYIEAGIIFDIPFNFTFDPFLYTPFYGSGGIALNF